MQTLVKDARLINRMILAKVVENFTIAQTDGGFAEAHPLSGKASPRHRFSRTSERSQRSNRILFTNPDGCAADMIEGGNMIEPLSQTIVYSECVRSSHQEFVVIVAPRVPHGTHAISHFHPHNSSLL